MLPLLKARQLRPDVLLDLARVKELCAHVTPNGADNAIEIGAMVRYRDLVRHPLLRERWSALTDAAAHIGDLQVQNRGTIGGNLVFGSVQTDMRQVVMCLSAELLIAGPEGHRTISALELFGDARKSMLKSNELLQSVSFPVPVAGSGSAYIKYGINANGRPVIGVVAALTIDASGTCSSARIVIGGILPNPKQAAKAEQVLIGERVDDDRIRSAAEAAAEEVTPQDDFRGSSTYRRQLIRVYGREALQRALSRAQEDIN